MTREEFYEKYGNYVVTFSSYYKYTFNYSANIADDKKIMVSYGGNAEQIYRYYVNPTSRDTVRNIEPYFGVVTDKDGKEIDSFYDYE